MMNRERGASLVEFALVLPLILMIVLGLVSAGVAYNLKITLTHAAREAARYAAILPTDSGVDDWLTSVESHLVADAEDTLASGEPGAAYCIAYVDGSESGANTKQLNEPILIGHSDPISSGWCFDDGRGDAEWRVQVVVQRDTDFNALFFSKTIGMTTEAVSRYEVMVGG
jgi:Flp pilus assembly protein TadG